MVVVNLDGDLTPENVILVNNRLSIQGSQGGHVMKIFSYIGNGAIVFLVLFGVMPAIAQNTYMNPFTGNSFNNPMSSTLDSTIMFSMQRRLTESQLLGTLPSQQGRTSSPPLYEQYQHGMPDRPMNAQPSWSSYPQYSNLPPPAGAPPPPPLPTSATAPNPASPPQHFPISATDFSSGQRVLPAAYAAKGPMENQAQLLQTFNAMMDAFEKAGRTNKCAYGIGFL